MRFLIAFNFVYLKVWFQIRALVQNCKSKSVFISKYKYIFAVQARKCVYVITFKKLYSNVWIQMPTEGLQASCNLPFPALPCRRNRDTQCASWGSAGILQLVPTWLQTDFMIDWRWLTLNWRHPIKSTEKYGWMANAHGVSRDGFRTSRAGFRALLV